MPGRAIPQLTWHYSVFKVVLHEVTVADKEPGANELETPHRPREEDKLHGDRVVAFFLVAWILESLNKLAMGLLSSGIATRRDDYATRF